MDPAPALSDGLAAVLFDMDGLLVDSEPQWFAAETRTVQQLGGVWGKQQQLDLLGSNLAFAAEYMIEHTESDRPAHEVMELLLENMTDELSRGVTFRPGALELVSNLASEGIAMALVTSSVRVHVEAVLQHVAGDPFQAIVTADDVTRLKPHPEPYLTALDVIGAVAAQTVVLEDSPTGIASAEAAGCIVVGIPSVVPIPAAPTRTVWSSLVGADVTTLRSLVTRS
ncbi:MAG: HAD family hydrolase [Actinomycetes bacterium]